MVTITVNGNEIPAEPGRPILAALRANGIRVPTLCNLDGLVPTGTCRVCLVELESPRRLVPSCAFPVAAGMRVHTHSPWVLEARKMVVELLLVDHPDDCLYCPRNRCCELQTLAEELGVRERRYGLAKKVARKDVSNPSIVRDQAKCVLCGRCVRTCQDVQTVSAIEFAGRGAHARIATAFDGSLNLSTCINCGQCIVVCPTAALTEQSAIAQVEGALDDPERIVVVQHAPAVSVSLGEVLGFPLGADVCGAMTAGLRRLGCARVFDTGFTADLTIMEEASELARRISDGGALPMLTSCSPGWIKFVEQEFPDFLPNLSSCKSPQQMMGALLKTFYAQRENLDPRRIFSLSIMPCTAKKFEAQRPEMGRGHLADVDAVLTTRELAQLLTKRGIDLAALAPEAADSPLGLRSSAGKLFGASGGVMEAALRTAHFLLTGRELDDLVVEDVRGLQGMKEARTTIGALNVGVAVVSGLGNARALLEQIRAGRRDLHFIEVMTCPGGCVAGGGQPLGLDRAKVAARMQKLYAIDQEETLRVSHRNEMVQALYDEFLGAPLGERSHELLHTHYHARS